MLTMTTDDLRETAAKLPELLTPHQRRILGLSCDGQTVVEIAGELGCSPATVTYHKDRIRAALGGVDWDVAKALYAAAPRGEAS
ncbi:MAG: hypothetical protein MOGMAGMI_02466 [Candidatus Omnitrophica bacterium]|nr:hypothetical protein [Candidatus Omnitrophota bacterium]